MCNLKLYGSHVQVNLNMAFNLLSYPQIMFSGIMNINTLGITIFPLHTFNTVYHFRTLRFILHNAQGLAILLAVASADTC